MHWLMSGSDDSPSPEIRTVFFNWPAFESPNLIGQQILQEMNIPQTRKFDRHSVTAFGLRESDHDSHTPGLFIVQKSPKLSHSIVHKRSDEGRMKDSLRRKETRARQRRAAAAANP